MFECPMQGGVLGPILFNCIVAQLKLILTKLDIKCHTYADDTQFQVNFNKFMTFV